MPASIALIIPVEPMAKGRPRVTRTGQVYTPAKTENAEAEARIAIRSHVLHSVKPFALEKPMFGDGVPISLDLIFVIPRPKSAPKKRQFPITRPDVDNYVKLIFDALNKFVWVDDSQVTTLVVKKRYGLMPAIHLIIHEEYGDAEFKKVELVGNDDNKRGVGTNKGAHLPGM
jgi:Holliday junction resolvase RusA-like endonuclease